jgi:hypothetical protein
MGSPPGSVNWKGYHMDREDRKGYCFAVAMAAAKMVLYLYLCVVFRPGGAENVRTMS